MGRWQYPGVVFRIVSPTLLSCVTVSSIAFVVVGSLTHFAGFRKSPTLLPVYSLSLIALMSFLAAFVVILGSLNHCAIFVTISLLGPEVQKNMSACVSNDRMNA